MKKLILKITFLLLLSGNVYGQSLKELTTTLKPQVGRKFCWAASMEMVLNFYNINRSQCDNTIYYVNDILRRTPSSCCSALCGVCSFPNNACTTCDVPLRDYNHYFDLFSALGVNSQVYNNRINSATWQTITKQIDNCMPMVLDFAVQGGMSDTMFKGNHAAILKGYYLPNLIDSFVIISDPWKPCIGTSSIILNYSIFWKGALGVYRRVQDYVKDIRRPQQLSCNDTFFNISRSTKILVESGITKTLSQEEFNALDSVKIPLKFVSPTMSLDSFRRLGLRTTFIEGDLVEVINRRMSIVTTMQLINDKWKPMEIKPFDYPSSWSVLINGQTIILDNFLRSPNSVRFEHIIFSESFYEFYKFEYKGKTYVVPLYDTSNLKYNGKKVYTYKPYNIDLLWESIKSNVPTLTRLNFINNSK